jgi:diaminopimelate decarboxylase
LNKDALYGNRFVNIISNELYLGSHSVRSLLMLYKTPTFLFIADKIKENINRIQKVFQAVFSQSQGYYSLKANYLQPVAELVRDCNFGMEIISHPEFKLLKKIHFPLDRVIAGGPYLPDDFLDDLIYHNIPYIVCYDLDDLFRIEQKCVKLGKKEQKIILRFTTPKYTGRQGIPFVDSLPSTLKDVLYACSHLRIVGILSHRGTQLNTKAEYIDNLRFIIEIYNTINLIPHCQIEIVNIGGGFPNADALKDSLLKEICSEMGEILDTAGMSHVRLFYEPGRFVVGDAGFCIARIIKYDSTHRTAFLDIGNQFIPKFMKSALRFYSIENITESPNFAIDFMGPVPSDQDILVKNYNFSPSIRSQDHVLIANVGSYALTFSTRFPYALPNIVWISGKEHYLIHDSQKSGDISLN